MIRERVHAPCTDSMRHTHRVLLCAILYMPVFGGTNEPAAAGDGLAGPPTLEDWDTSDVSESLQRLHFSRRGPGRRGKKMNNNVSESLQRPNFSR